MNVTMGNHVLLCTKAQARETWSLILTTHKKKLPKSISTLFKFWYLIDFQWGLDWDLVLRLYYEMVSKYKSRL